MVFRKKTNVTFYYTTYAFTRTTRSDSKQADNNSPCKTVYHNINITYIYSDKFSKMSFSKTAVHCIAIMWLPDYRRALSR